MGQVGSGKCGRWVVSAFEILTAGAVFGQSAPKAESTSLPLATQTFKDIDWPRDAAIIAFDYLFRAPRRAENLTVYVRDKIFYYDNAEITVARDQLTSSGEIYVGDVSGQTARLNFVLRTDQPDGGTLGGSILINNIRVFGFVSGDADLDADRDIADLAALVGCFQTSPVTENCWSFDVDGNDVVDYADFAEFRLQMNGPTLPPIS